MSAIINIGSSNTLPSTTPSVVERRITDRSLYPAEQNDTVELSRFARALARAVDLSSFSVARTRAIRTEIDNGTFETPERLAGTVDRLLDVIG